MSLVKFTEDIIGNDNDIKSIRDYSNKLQDFLQKLFQQNHILVLRKPHCLSCYPSYHH